MTPAALLQASIELSETIAGDPRPADQTVADWLRQRRFIGAKDRRWLTQSVYDRLRRRARVDWWLTQIGLVKSERTRALAEQVLAEAVQPGELAQLCSGQRFGPPPLSPRERRALDILAEKKLDWREQPPEVQGECPAWLLPRFGEDAAATLTALAGGAPLNLRVNSLKATREEAQAKLKEEGIDARPTPLSPLGLRVPGRPNVAATAAFREGLVERQDEGSQVAALLVGAQPGQRVVDFCAGAGGKTLALAAAMENKGSIVATDVLQGRVERAGERLRRAGAHNVTRKALTDHRDPWVKRHKGGFDRVLVDAPCSGTGAWRRNPDARWRATPEDLERVKALQAEILDSAWRLVKPGGRLVYVTCSLLPEENRAQVEHFLAGHPDFALLPLPQVWAETLGGTCPTEADDLTLRPELQGTDGFYVAVLERRRGAAA